jgi:hypothetical protein
MAIFHIRFHHNTCTQMPVTNISIRAYLSAVLQFEKLSPKNNAYGLNFVLDSVKQLWKYMQCQEQLVIKQCNPPMAFKV